MKATLLISICYLVVILATMGFNLFIITNEGLTVKSIIFLIVTCVAVCVLYIPISIFISKRKL